MEPDEPHHLPLRDQDQVIPEQEFHKPDQPDPLCDLFKLPLFVLDCVEVAIDFLSIHGLGLLPDDIAKGLFGRAQDF